MRNKFDMQLERLNSQLTHMGEMCEIAITRATKALEDGKIDEAKSVQEADEEIDQLEKDIERLCLKVLLQQQTKTCHKKDSGQTGHFIRAVDKNHFSIPFGTHSGQYWRQTLSTRKDYR